MNPGYQSFPEKILFVVHPEFGFAFFRQEFPLWICTEADKSISFLKDLDHKSCHHELLIRGAQWGWIESLTGIGIGTDDKFIFAQREIDEWKTWAPTAWNKPKNWISKKA